MTTHNTASPKRERREADITARTQSRDRQGADDVGADSISPRCKLPRSLTVAVLSVFAIATSVEHPVLAAGPQVQIVLAAQAEPLEKFAADEMAGQLKKLFEADVTISTTAPADAANVILLGNPATHEVLKDLNLALPKLSDQGHALKSVKLGDKAVLVVAGGSPRAVMWAAYELGWQFGIRYFLFGDLFPTQPKPFTVEGFDLALEPLIRGRGFCDWDQSIFGPEVWSVAEYKQVLGQMAKLKATGFLRDEFLEEIPKIRVDGDTVGRNVFAGAKYFGDPDLANADSASDFSQRYSEKFTAIRDEAARLGIEYGFAGGVHSAVPPFRPQPPRMGSRGVLPQMGHSSASATVIGLWDFHSARENLRSGLTTELRKEYDTRFPDQLVRQDRPFTPDPMCGDVMFRYLIESRGTFKPQPPVDLLNDCLAPVCGDGVAERVIRAFDLCEQNVTLISRNTSGFSTPKPDMLTRHFDSDEPPPAWWAEVRTNYLNAMSEMYRANTRAREGGRQFTLWYARRFEFGFEYMNAVEALRKAGIAKRKGNNDEQIAELEKALDSITNACNAMAAVARSQSDRGVIAVMNEYGYRPVMKLLEAADAGN